MRLRARRISLPGIPRPGIGHAKHVPLTIRCADESVVVDVTPSLHSLQRITDFKLRSNFAFAVGSAVVASAPRRHGVIRLTGSASDSKVRLHTTGGRGDLPRPHLKGRTVSVEVSPVGHSAELEGDSKPRPDFSGQFPLNAGPCPRLRKNVGSLFSFRPALPYLKQDMPTRRDADHANVRVTGLEKASFGEFVGFVRR